MEDKLKAIEIIGALNEFNDTSVTNAITYYYAITTMNAIGESKKSTIIYAIPGGPPTAPRNLNTEVGDGYIFLTWNHPLNNNGFPIINYAIYRGKAANNLTILTTIGNITSYNDTSTKNGVDYFYAVSAFNTKGEGKASDEVTTAAGNPPSVPLNLVAEKVEDYVLLTWDIPSDNGGFEITFYRIYRGLNEIEFNEIAETDQLNYFDSSTIGGVAYYYSVSAINIKGEGERSDVVPVKPIEPLGKPDNITTEGGNGYVFISWEPPVNSYGTTISRYNLYKGTNPLEELQLFSVSLELFFNDTNVENDVTYYYIISAFSTDGEGTKSEIVYATPLKPTGDTNGHLNVPGIPENFIVEAGDGFVYLKWQPPIETHGIEIIGYRIYRGDSESQQPAFYIYTYILTFNDTSVINNNSYYYQLSTVNKFGEGNKTHIAKITPRPWPGPYP